MAHRCGRSPRHWRSISSAGGTPSGRAVSVAGREQCSAAQCPSGGNHPLDQGVGAPPDAADTPERLLHELVLQASLGTPLIATKGWAAPEVATAYRRAQALWERLGETPQYCWVLYGLCAWHAMRAEWQTARALMERLLTLAQRVHHPTLLMHAHLGLGGILYCLGAFAAVRAHIEQGLALYDPRRTLPRSPMPCTIPRWWGAAVRPEPCGIWAIQSRRGSTLMRRSPGAQELAHPFTLAQVFYCATTFALVRQEVQVARERADALITLATAQGFPFQLASGMLCRGLVLIEQGQQEEGMRQIQQGLAAHRATGAAAGQPCPGLSRQGLWARRPEQQRAAGAGRGADAGAPHGGAVLRGGAVSAQGRAAARKAKAPRHRAGAKAGGSRAEFSSSPRRRPKPAGENTGAAGSDEPGPVVATAGQVLQAAGCCKVYGWFTEGFDTADLQEAKALLEALA